MHYLSEPVKEYAYATEIVLAEAERLDTQKSASKSHKERLAKRSTTMVINCWRFGVTPEIAGQWKNIRLAERLSQGDFRGHTKLNDQEAFLRREAERNRQLAIECLSERRVLNEQKPSDTIASMQMAAQSFYLTAVQIGVHPFIEFAGLLTEYIEACRSAAEQGIDFTQASVHTGNHIPLEPYQIAYIQEKLNCIYGAQMATAIPAQK